MSGPRAVAPRPDLAPAAICAALAAERERLQGQRNAAAPAVMHQIARLGRLIGMIDVLTDAQPGARLPRAIRLEQVRAIVATADHPVDPEHVARRLRIGRARAEALLRDVQRAHAAHVALVRAVRHLAR